MPKWARLVGGDRDVEQNRRVERRGHGGPTTCDRALAQAPGASRGACAVKRRVRSRISETTASVSLAADDDPATIAAGSCRDGLSFGTAARRW
jgi:hypothetical protein